MLKILIEGTEFYDEVENKFHTTEDLLIELEHSLLSVSKWEAKHLIPFLTDKEKTSEQLFDYVMCMILTPGITPEQVEQHKAVIFEAVNGYINSPQSATTFGELPKKRSAVEIITSELVYFWMTAFSIPFECETWHLNRLFSLIRIAGIKTSKPERMPRHELAQRNRQLNEQRRAQLNTRG